MATGLLPAQGFLPFSDPVLNSPTTVVHLDHLPGSELGIGHNESDPWEELPSCHSIYQTRRRYTFEQ